MFGFDPQRMLSDAVGGTGNAFSNLASGVFGNLWGAVRNTLVIIGLKMFAAPVWAAGVKAIKGEAGYNEWRARMEKGGNPQMVMDSAVEGTAIAAATGGIQGILGGAGGGIGGLIGPALVLVAGAAVTIGALNNHKDGAKTADNDPKHPPATPAGGKPKLEVGKA